MRKFCIIILSALFLSSCNLKTTQNITHNGKTYKCIDLNNGIYLGEDGHKYHITYTVDKNSLIIFLVEVKK